MSAAYSTTSPHANSVGASRLVGTGIASCSETLSELPSSLTLIYTATTPLMYQTCMIMQRVANGDIASIQVKELQVAGFEKAAFVDRFVQLSHKARSFSSILAQI